MGEKADMAEQASWRSLLFTPESKRRRFAESTKFVPVLYVVCIILCLYLIYVFGHCWAMLASHDKSLNRTGHFEIAVFHVLTGMLIICYLRSLLCHPGEIPEDDVQWDYIAQDTRLPQANSVAANLQETKKSGDRRHCKWCSKYKPDRCHHCRACRTCILKMDHHCPWIYNCVGYKNYKYFFLLLLYTGLDLHWIVWTMLPSLRDCVMNPDTLFIKMFAVLFGETLALFLGVLVTLFWGFHIWLMMRSMTTIEFCEKSLPKKGGVDTSKDRPVYDGSVYNLGPIGNIKVVLGDNPFLWLVPASPPRGDGLNFVTSETRLTTDLEAAKGIRRKTHQRVQRSTPVNSRAVARAAAYAEQRQALEEVSESARSSLYGASLKSGLEPAEAYVLSARSAS